MKKRLAAMILALSLLIGCFTISSAASSYHQADIEQEIARLMEQYCGTYWYSNFNGAIQCKGFADMVFADLFGTGAPGPYSDSKYYLPNATSRSCACLGILSPGECTPEALRALLSRALPGDYVQCVRYSGTQHSMIVVETTDTGITFFDCNLKGSYLCASYTYTWEEVGKYLTRGCSLYRHDGYVPSTEYHLYFDPNGGECELDSKLISVGSHYGVLPTPVREGYTFDYWYIREFNSSRTPAEYVVTTASTKTAYSDTYLIAHWSEALGPCALNGHLWEKMISFEPTCEEPGYTSYVCGECGEEWSTDFTEPTGHSYELLGTVPATRVDDGSDTYACTKCGKSYSVPIICAFNKFEDLSAKSWYYPYVHDMVEGGYMNGLSENAFAPDGTLTRAMLVTVLYRMQGEPEAADAGFKDVKSSAWYAKAVNWAKETGVVNGYPDNTFRPNAAITREQAAAILYRYSSDVLGRSTSSRASLQAYKDSRSIASYAVAAMEWANACKILSGFPDSTMKPKGNASRAQIAKMLVTMLNTDQPQEGVG